MKNKYNIALLPILKGNAVIKYSQQLAELADQYLLGEKSLPHVTLYQLEAHENELKDTWDKVCSALEKKSIDLVFEKWSCITFDNTIFWASLLPNHYDELMAMHEIVALAINKPKKNNYDPHMTLINTRIKEYEDTINELATRYVPIEDTFVLSIGKSDAIGQYTEIVYLSTINTKDKS